MSSIDVQRVGDSVLLVIDETQVLMPRDIAVSIGLALVKVGGALGSDTLDSDPSQQQSPTTYGTVTDQNADTEQRGEPS